LLPKVRETRHASRVSRKSDSATPLASVVFLKIQEFARRPVQEQARLRAQLEAVVAVTAAELAPADRVILDASDGIAVVVLDAPSAALALAERALAAFAAGLPLVAGINHGAVKLAGGKKQEGMIGDGISVAASVADFASSKRLLVSRAFRDALADESPGAEAVLAPAGTFTDSGLRSHELFTPDPNAPGRRRRRFRALAAMSIVVFVGAGFGVRASADPREPRFFDGALAKVKQSTRSSEAFLRSLAQKVKF
jgi:class 3 adenylate cyclase